ncbi:MAG: helix-turn-helix domain-containing protein [Thermodesulfobacteriota bacterium]|nr:helix-turn-helix domain-containing protein [Thermodesulfobacteriota bacterium]
MKQQNTPQGPGSVRKIAIIEATLTLFSNNGFASTGMYHHFKSKEQLAAAVFPEGIGSYQQSPIAPLNRSFARRIARWFQTHIGKETIQPLAGILLLPFFRGRAGNTAGAICPERRFCLWGGLWKTGPQLPGNLCLQIEEHLHKNNLQQGIA